MKLRLRALVLMSHSWPLIIFRQPSRKYLIFPFVFLVGVCFFNSFIMISLGMDLFDFTLLVIHWASRMLRSIFVIKFINCLAVMSYVMFVCVV